METIMVDGFVTVKVELSKGITIPIPPQNEGDAPGKRRIKSITFREPDVEQIDAISRAPGFEDDDVDPTIGQQCEVFAILSDEVSGSDLKKMHPLDFAEVANAIAPLLQTAMSELAKAMADVNDRIDEIDVTDPEARMPNTNPPRSVPRIVPETDEGPRPDDPGPDYLPEEIIPESDPTPEIDEIPESDPEPVSDHGSEQPSGS